MADALKGQHRALNDLRLIHRGGITQSWVISEIETVLAACAVDVATSAAPAIALAARKRAIKQVKPAMWFIFGSEFLWPMI
jgi:hypothetical protein